MPPFKSSLRPAMLAFIALAHSAQARPQPDPWKPAALHLRIDGYQSPEMGADDFLALHYAAGRGIDAALKPVFWNEQRFWARFGGFWYRFGKLLYIELPLAYSVSVAQHEYFGHGWRGREFGFNRITYGFGLPPPYGGGGGVTHFRNADSGTYTWDKDIAIATGGEEAERILGDRLRLSWARTGRMDTRGSLLYILARTSLRNYIAGSDEAELAKDDPDYSNDMLHYLYSLNEKETPGPVGPYTEWRLRLKRLEAQQNWGLADPFFWYSIWGVFAKGLWQGKREFGYPAAPIGPARVLPAIGYDLGPWGPEYQVQALAGWAGRAISLGYRQGDDTFRRSYGWDLATLDMVRFRDFRIDLDAHFWQQPRIRYVVSETETSREAGYAAGFNALSPQLPGRIPLRISIGAGWKSRGYVPGKELEKGASWSFGLAWTPARPSGS